MAISRHDHLSAQLLALLVWLDSGAVPVLYNGGAPVMGQPLGWIEQGCRQPAPRLAGAYSECNWMTRSRRLVLLLLWLSASTASVLLLGTTAPEPAVHRCGSSGGAELGELQPAPRGEQRSLGRPGKPSVTPRKRPGHSAPRQERAYAVYVPTTVSSDEPVTLLMAFFPMEETPALSPPA